MVPVEDEKLVITLPHPEEELRVLSDALKQLQQPCISMEEIQRCRRVIREALASQRVLRAYNRYLKAKISRLEQEVAGGR